MVENMMPSGTTGIKVDFVEMNQHLLHITSLGISRFIHRLHYIFEHRPNRNKKTKLVFCTNEAEHVAVNADTM